MAKQTASILQWEVWYVDWPHEDGSSKKRPALVISPDSHNREQDHIYFMKISSRRPLSDHFLALNSSDPAYKETNLNPDKGTMYFWTANVEKLPKTTDCILNHRGHIPALTAMAIGLMIGKVRRP